ncbi:hypothetical protein KGF54_005617 [Candida jiufengensis]|uniref:uncharacterized protein n=1 Tax=Candida jiufengensis TaxID=497108 RepID=UPI0022259E94|nr:uncharacterized protein KGF54_005617 [Candida jiufengensis]KAI5949382.1 hypothetical protein KGF54_005617 [Candida jiufengensis]
MSSNIQFQENIKKDTSFDYPSPNSPSISKNQTKESSIEVKVPQQHNFTKIGIFRPAKFSRHIFKQLENLQISKTQFFKDLKKQSESENQTVLENQCKDNIDLSYNLQFKYFTDFLHAFHPSRDPIAIANALDKNASLQLEYFNDFIDAFNQYNDANIIKIKEYSQYQYFNEFIHVFTNKSISNTKEDLPYQYFKDFIQFFNQSSDLIFINNNKEDLQYHYFNEFIHVFAQSTDPTTTTSSSSSTTNLNNTQKMDKVIQFIYNPNKPDQKKLGKLEKFKNFIRYGTTKGKETQDIPKHVEKYVLNKIKIAKTTNNKIDISSISETLKQEQLTQEELDLCLYKIYSSGCKKSLHSKLKLFKKNKNRKEPPIKGCLKNKENQNQNLEQEAKACEEADSQTIEKFMSELVYRENRGLDPIYKRNIKNTQLQQVQNYYGDNVEVYLEQ